MKIIIGSRGSNLAVIQSESVRDLLKEKNPNLDIEIKIIKTKGDKMLDRPIHKIGDKGVFVKELELALLNEEIDLAVHSMKDMPSQKTEGLKFSNPPMQSDPRDAIVSNKKIQTLKDLENKILGTGSLRRSMQLKNLLPNVETKAIRGNIETRMKKIETENLSGVILAAAGLLRANHGHRIDYYFSTDEIIPAPCQGILAIQYREDDLEMKKLLDSISDPMTTYRYEAERAFQAELNADCHSPIGVYAKVDGEKIIINAVFGDADKNILIRDFIKGDLKDRIELGRILAKRLKENVNAKRQS
ncbi:MAG: hydroxymethylbilane synthase [Tissierellia bacterium]|nr:hydroxymethylbilane synthase [Tissierellia bacterium]